MIIRWKGKTIDEIVNNIDNIVRDNMLNIGYTALDESKKTPPTPVLTGHLRSSERVRFENRGWRAVLYVNLNEVPYARRIYYGWGSYVGKRYFEVGIQSKSTQNAIRELERDLDIYLKNL